MDPKVEQLQRALEGLPPKCRRVFILVYYHEYLFWEVAAEMKISSCQAELLYNRVIEYLKRIADAD